jgi:hypothetical protein
MPLLCKQRNDAVTHLKSIKKLIMRLVTTPSLIGQLVHNSVVLRICALKAKKPVRDELA